MGAITERAKILAEAIALKKASVDYAHPEVKVSPSDVFMITTISVGSLHLKSRLKILSSKLRCLQMLLPYAS